LTDHSWHQAIQVHAHLGHPENVRCYEVIANDPLAVAITGQVCALSQENGCGVKFRIGPLWWKRIHEEADGIAQALDALE
jgi:hypothetical protein